MWIIDIDAAIYVSRIDETFFIYAQTSSDIESLFPRANPIRGEGDFRYMAVVDGIDVRSAVVAVANRIGSRSDDVDRNRVGLLNQILCTVTNALGGRRRLSWDETSVAPPLDAYLKGSVAPRAVRDAR